MKSKLDALIGFLGAGSLVLAGLLVPSFHAEHAAPPFGAPFAAPAVVHKGTAAKAPTILVMHSSLAALPVEKKAAVNFDLGSDVKRVDNPLLLDGGKHHRVAPEKFSIKLYRLTDKPNMLVHIRQVDHNEIGYGGGLKFAIEMVEDF